MKNKITSIDNKINELHSKIEKLKLKKLKHLYKQAKKELLEEFKVGDKVYKEVQKEPYDTTLTKIHYVISSIIFDDDKKKVTFYDELEKEIITKSFKIIYDGNSGYFSNIKIYEGNLEKED